MSSRNAFILHTLDGGWATDTDPVVTDLPRPGDGQISVPFLPEAENIEYSLPRGVRKVGGTVRVDPSDIVSATTTVTGLYDYWRYGSTGIATRRRICHAGARILSDTDDGVFATTLASSQEVGAIPSYDTFDDLLIIGSSSTVDVPRSWDQTTFQNLAGSPPRFSFSVHQHNRQWAAGVYTAPSRLYYSNNLDPEDWTGAGSGSIDIDPNDGDMITGLAAYKDEVWVFKGPYKGSIHRITGKTTSTFARTMFIRGLGAVWHNSIVPFGDDLAFLWSTGTVHSLKATDAFGDYNQAFLTRPINKWIEEDTNKNRLKYAWGINDTMRNRLLFGLSRNAIQYNDAILVYDYRFQPGKWALWTLTTAASLGYFIDGGGADRRVYAGTTNGRIRKLNMPTRAVDGSTAYTANVGLPTFSYGSPRKEKTLVNVGLGLVPKGNWNATVTWSRDGKEQQNTTVSMRGGDVLDTTFKLDLSPLGGLRYTNTYKDTEEGGNFRGIQYGFSQSGASQDMEVRDVQAEVIMTDEVSAEDS